MFAGIGLTSTPHASGIGDAIAVDQAGQTAVPGVYAAGNVADPSMQVAHAAAHGSRVGAMIAFDLADDDLRAAVRASADQADWDHRYGGDSNVWSGNPNGTLVAEVDAIPSGRALDIGAGEGGDAIWLAERGWTVTANDISAAGLARVAAEAERRGLAVDRLHADANDRDAFGERVFDLVSMQYGSIHRTPDRRALSNLLGAVAPGGTLLVVGHDPAPWRAPRGRFSQRSRSIATSTDCRRSVTGPRPAPSPIVRPSTSRTGVRPPKVPVTNASSALYTSVSEKSRSWAAMPAARAVSSTTARVMPGRL